MPLLTADALLAKAKAEAPAIWAARKAHRDAAVLKQQGGAEACGLGMAVDQPEVDPASFAALVEGEGSFGDIIGHWAAQAVLPELARAYHEQQTAAGRRAVLERFVLVRQLEPTRKKGLVGQYSAAVRAQYHRFPTLEELAILVLVGDPAIFPKEEDNAYRGNSDLLASSVDLRASKAYRSIYNAAEYLADSDLKKREVGHRALHAERRLYASVHEQRLAAGLPSNLGGKRRRSEAPVATAPPKKAKFSSAGLFSPLSPGSPQVGEVTPKLSKLTLA